MLLVVLLSVLFIYVAVQIYKLIYNDYWKKRNIVQEGDLIAKFIFGDRSVPELYKDIYEKYSSETYIGVFLGRQKGLVLRDLRDIQFVLANDFESFYSRGFLINDNDVLGNNLLSVSNYNRWKLIRQKISPIFTSAKLRNMCYILEKSASDFVEMMKENKEMRENPFNALYTYSTASIGASVFGIDTNMKSSMDSPFLEMAWKTVVPSFRANIQMLISAISPTLFRWLDCKPFGDHEEFFVGAVKKILDMRRKETKIVHDFVDLCLELQKNGTMKDQATGFELEPTDEVMAAQAFFFFLAGTDTSATTMLFTLVELASNPHVLKKLHKEIDDVFAKSDGKATFEAIESMQYMDMVLNEAMRKYPPIGMLLRECTRDTVLPVGNLKVEKGVLVVAPVLGLHRDPKYFPNPNVFDPERFTPENMAKIPNYVYMPFGEGKRMCLGKFNFFINDIRK
jgi:cytochrome P450 family 6